MYIVFLGLCLALLYKILPGLTDSAIMGMFEAGMTSDMFRILKVFSILASILSAIIIRTAGQYIFGKIAGFRFLSVQLGTRVLVRHEGGFSMRRLYFPAYMPLIHMMPADSIKRGQWAIHLLGGVIANGIAVVIFAVLSRVVSPTAEYMLLTCMLMSGVLCLEEAIPMKIGNSDNVGKSIVLLFKNPDVQHIMRRNAELMDLQLQGMQVKDMPERLFVLRDEQADNRIIESWKAVYFQRLVCECRFEEAAELVHDISTSRDIPKGDVGSLICDVIMCEIGCECRIDMISKRFTPAFRRYMKRYKNMPHVLRTRYAEELLINRDADAALKVHERFEKVAADYLKPGIIETDREFMAIIDKKAKEIVRDE